MNIDERRVVCRLRSRRVPRLIDQEPGPFEAASPEMNSEVHTSRRGRSALWFKDRASAIARSPISIPESHLPVAYACSIDSSAVHKRRLGRAKLLGDTIRGFDAPLAFGQPPGEAVDDRQSPRAPERYAQLVALLGQRQGPTAVMTNRLELAAPRVDQDERPMRASPQRMLWSDSATSKACSAAARASAGRPVCW